MRIFAVILLWLSAIVGASASEPIATLPYRIDYGGWFTVSVTVNGHGPYDFVIDTGSTLTLAFENLAAIEGFEPTGGESLRILGISSAKALAPYRLGDIGVGAATLRDHVGVVLADWEAPRRTPHGIIGLDFLRQYAVHFDQSTRTMTLYEHGGIPGRMTQDLSPVKLRPRDFGKSSGALFTASGLINRKPTTFIIDLGSISSLINYRSAEAIFSSVITSNSGVNMTTGSHLKDIFDDRTRARTALINRVQLGRVSWRNQGMWIYNAPIFDELEVQRLAFGLAGVDLLADRNFALDFGENKMFIAKKPS